MRSLFGDACFGFAAAFTLTCSGFLAVFGAGCFLGFFPCAPVVTECGSFRLFRYRLAADGALFAVRQSGFGAGCSLARYLFCLVSRCLVDDIYSAYLMTADGAVNDFIVRTVGFACRRNRVFRNRFGRRMRSLFNLCGFDLSAVALAFFCTERCACRFVGDSPLAVSVCCCGVLCCYICIGSDNRNILIPTVKRIVIVIIETTCKSFGRGFRCGHAVENAFCLYDFAVPINKCNRAERILVGAVLLAVSVLIVAVNCGDNNIAGYLFGNIAPVLEHIALVGSYRGFPRLAVGEVLNNRNGRITAQCAVLTAVVGYGVMLLFTVGNTVAVEVIGVNRNKCCIGGYCLCRRLDLFAVQSPVSKALAVGLGFIGFIL